MRLWRVAIGNLRRDLGSSLLLSLAVASGVGALIFFVALGRGVTRELRRLFPEAARTVEVIPAHVRLGGLLGGRLDDAAVARLAAIPGVHSASRKMMLRAAASSIYRGSFFGTPLDLAVEIAAVGVEPGLVAPDLLPGESFSVRPGAPIPACVSDRLLALYNTTFAPSRGLPPLAPSLLAGFTLPVTIGRSLVAPIGSGPVETVPIRIVCVSPRALLAGLTVPLEVVRSWNLRRGLDAESYSSVALAVAAEDELPAVVEAVQAMGFSVDESERTGARAAGGAAALVTLVLELLAWLVTGLAAAGIGQALTATVRSRRREIGLLRALGATPWEAAGLVLWEAAVIGLCGGILGVALGLLAAVGIDRIALRQLPSFPGKPATLFALSWGLCLAGIAVGCAAGQLGAFLPARLAARLDPTRALAGS